MTGLTILCVVSFILLCTAVVVFICMNSSRLSELDEPFRRFKCRDRRKDGKR